MTPNLHHAAVRAAARKQPDVAKMRPLFEQAVKECPQLRDNTPLGTMEVNGKFTKYMDPDTDTLWIGFALGMRVKHREDKGLLIQNETRVAELEEALRQTTHVCKALVNSYEAVRSVGGRSYDTAPGGELAAIVKLSKKALASARPAPGGEAK